MSFANKKTVEALHPHEVEHDKAKETHKPQGQHVQRRPGRGRGGMKSRKFNSERHETESSADKLSHVEHLSGAAYSPYEILSSAQITEHYELEKRAFIKHIHNSLLPIKFLMRVTGRFPLKYVRDENEDGGGHYEFILVNGDGIYFIVVTVISFYILVMITVNLTDTFINIRAPSQIKSSKRCENQRLFELVMFDRYLVGSVVLWTAFVHVLLGSVTFIFKRDYAAHFFTIWTTLAFKIHMDMGHQLYRATLVDMTVFLASILILGIMTFFRLTATVTGETSYFSLLLFRLYQPCMLNRYGPQFYFNSFYYTANVMAGMLFFYIFIASKCFVFLFLYLCRMMKHSVMTWNGRFFAAVLCSSNNNLGRHWGRTTKELLFEDHCLLLNLISGSDEFFSPNIECYFGLQLVSVIFEIYSVLRFAKFGTANSEMVAQKFYLRRLDWIPGMIILLVNIFLLTMILKAAADVEEEAMLGLEIIRRKTMLGNRSEKTKNFMLSMFYSYTNYGNVGLSGGGYFSFNNELVIKLVSLFFSYFIVTYQFQPIMDYQYDLEAYNNKTHFSWHGRNNLTNDEWLLKRREDIGTFVRDVEGMHDRHWLYEPPLPNGTFNITTIAVYCVLIGTCPPLAQTG